MNTHDIAAKLRLLLSLPLAPGLNALACIGGVYCAVRHQLRCISLPCPAAVFVLRGQKIVWRGQERMEVRAGQMFVLPSRMEITIFEQPPNFEFFNSLLGAQILCLALPDCVEGLNCSRLPKKCGSIS